MYTVVMAHAANREFQKLPEQAIRRLTPAIDGLTDDPRPLNSVKLKGSMATYRLRLGRYRVVYEVDDHRRIVLITRVRHRKDAY